MNPNDHTVIVLGAGASVELGFPLGEQLKIKIKERCREIGNATGLDLDDYRALDRVIGVDEDMYTKACDKLEGFPLSIDEFIEMNPEFNSLCRHMIAIVL